jgi:hypothetical protein
MRSSISWFSFLLLLVLVSLVASSCVMADPPVSANTSTQDAPTLIQAFPDVTDPPTLDVKVTISEGQNDSDGLTAITIQFSTNEISNPNYVQFVKGEKVMCNGVTLGFGGTAYSARVPAVDNAYTCKYYQRSNKPFNIISVKARTKLSPAFVPDTSGDKFVVDYSPDKTQFRSPCHIQVDASDSSQTISGPSVLEDGNGVYTGPDRSALTGEGTVVMTRTCSFKLKKGTAADTATAFEKVTATYTSTATSVVVWF